MVFDDQVYATEATTRIGQLMMEDLISMQKEFRQFYGSEDSGCAKWKKWEELVKLPPSLQEIILGKDGTELGCWLSLYRYYFANAAPSRCYQLIMQIC